ncbi:hypothetical protein [Phytohabitans suffuscus]|uniref:Uncharacterized protein n=1 Tax=Phytohabitans suffuscus TaxID=624315 RepID=A0A6F8YKG6_9ACTN|nr:hypothetical protein [Phytohabitans suffuscus]BCB86509.1 hypothetical protein Psuf_038220 [Phytohabitans suffuscus]
MPDTPLVEAAAICLAALLFAAAVALLRGGRRPHPMAPALAPPSAGPVYEPPAAHRGDPGPAASLAHQPPEQPVATERVELVGDLRAGELAVAVSLNGVRGDALAPPFGWRGAGQASPLAVLPVVLGERAGLRLFADLARCPDVLTVLGARPHCQRYALRLVRQVLAIGGRVTVVGDVFGEPLPAGCHRAADVSDVDRSAVPGIVVCGRLTRAAGNAALELRASGGPVPVLLGDVPASRWSVWLRAQRPAVPEPRRAG